MCDSSYDDAKPDSDAGGGTTGSDCGPNFTGFANCGANSNTSCNCNSSRDRDA
jgi:hypothetical protein